jgi:hypothetical protein
MREKRGRLVWKLVVALKISRHKRTFEKDPIRYKRKKKPKNKKELL